MFNIILISINLLFILVIIKLLLIINKRDETIEQLEDDFLITKLATLEVINRFDLLCKYLGVEYLAGTFKKIKKSAHSKKTANNANDDI